MFIGLMVVSLGVLMLLRTMGVIGSIGEYIAPLAIISVGLHIAFGGKRRRN